MGELMTRLADEYQGWKVHWMQGLLRGGDDELCSAQTDTVLAPNLDWAFKRARAMWPWADGWRFIGYQDPNNHECVLDSDNQKRVTELVVRSEE